MIEVLRAGPLTTVQDCGRRGLRHLGVPGGGALDQLALARAHALLANPAAAAALELIAGPLELRFGRAGWLALCGAAFEMRLDGRPLRPEWRWPFAAGQVLRLDGPLSGQRAVLAFDGGLALPPVLGDRALRRGGVLALGAPHALRGVRGLAAPVWEPLLRALPGPELDRLDSPSHSAFWTKDWAVTAQSDRMGARLAGPTLRLQSALELASTAVLPGVVQLPPVGQPIVLLADCGTTGGYPRLATVIEADLWKLAQCRPGQTLRFVASTLDDARAALAQQRHEIAQWRWVCATST